MTYAYFVKWNPVYRIVSVVLKLLNCPEVEKQFTVVIIYHPLLDFISANLEPCTFQFSLALINFGSLKSFLIYGNRLFDW